MRKTLKRILGCCLVLCLILSLFSVAPLSAGAAETDTAGSFTWSIDDNGVLTVSGDGAIPDYEFDTSSYTGNRPWENRTVYGVVIEDGITRVGNNAFAGSQINSLELSASVDSVGEKAFANCGSLAQITVLKKDTDFAEDAFYGSGTYCGCTVKCYKESTIAKYPFTENNFQMNSFQMIYFGEYTVYYYDSPDDSGEPRLLKEETSDAVPYIFNYEPTSDMGYVLQYWDDPANYSQHQLRDTALLMEGDKLYLYAQWGYTVRFMDGDKLIDTEIAPVGGDLFDVPYAYPNTNDRMCTGYTINKEPQINIPDDPNDPDDWVDPYGDDWYVTLGGWNKSTPDEKDIKDGVLTLYAQFSDESAPTIKKSLTLTGNIGLNFYLEGDFFASEMSFEVKNPPVPDEDEEKKIKKYTIPLYAKNMADKIVANVTYKKTEKIMEYISWEDTYYEQEISVAIGFAKIEYSIADYCNAVISSENDDKLQAYYLKQGMEENDAAAKVDQLKTLCKSMLNYGAQAQKQFGYKTDDLANKGIEYTPDDFDINSLSTADTDNDYPEGITYYGSTIGLLSNPYYMVILESPLSVNDGNYISVTGNPSNWCVGYSYRTVNGTEIEQTDLYSYLMLSDPDNPYDYSPYGIPITKLLKDQTQEITIYHKEGNVTTSNVYSFTFNPGAYIRRVLEKSDDDQLRATVTALYDYSVKAAAYFGSDY